MRMWRRPIIENFPRKRKEAYADDETINL